MMTRNSRPIPEPLVPLQQQFQQFRATHPPRSKLPDEFWKSAAGLAKQHGLYTVAHALRLDYMWLKNRVGGSGRWQRKQTQPRFVELIMPRPPNLDECVIEFESVGGAKMRIQWRINKITRATWCNGALPNCHGAGRMPVISRAGGDLATNNRVLLHRDRHILPAYEFHPFFEITALSTSAAALRSGRATPDFRPRGSPRPGPPREFSRRYLPTAAFRSLGRPQGPCGIGKRRVEWEAARQPPQIPRPPSTEITCPVM
jgi:hypothetical protein